MMTGFGMDLGGGLVFVLFWVVLIVGAVWLARAVWPAGQELPAPVTHSEPSADEILKLRYARGELTQEQFEQMRRDLSV